VALDRRPVLQRALRGLPLSVLEPLLRGLRGHADRLVAGHIQPVGDGACAVGMMLREMGAEPDPPRTQRELRRRRREVSIWNLKPSLARAHPRLHHVEIVFDSTCQRMAERGEVAPREIPRAVGLWMAAETHAEINVRHLEGIGAADRPARTARVDERLFDSTVTRLRELRPGLSRDEAEASVEAAIGARRADPDPLFVPGGWEREVAFQRDRLGA
jgi:hypothetical protein